MCIRDSATAEGHVDVDTGLPIGDVGANAGVDAYVKAGAHAEGDVSVGEHGVAASGETFAGHAEGVDATVGIDTGIVSSEATGGVSVGTQVGVGGAAHFTVENGHINIGVAGEAAALIGVELDVDADIDVNACIDTANAVYEATKDPQATAEALADSVHQAEKAYNEHMALVAKQAKEVAEQQAKAAAEAAAEAEREAKRMAEEVAAEAQRIAEEQARQVAEAAAEAQRQAEQAAAEAQRILSLIHISEPTRPY